MSNALDLSGVLPSTDPARKKRRHDSLTARLLSVAAGFVVLTEAVVYVPTIAGFRHEWLVERFDTGEVAVLATRAIAGNGNLRAEPRELLRAAGIQSVSILTDNTRQTLVGQVPSASIHVINLENQTFGGAIFDVFETLGAPPDRVLALTSRPRSNAAIKLEVIVPEAALRDALLRETGRVLLYSLLLAFMIGVLMYAALADGFVRPMRRLTNAIMKFRSAPEDGSRSLIPSGRQDEIGEAEVAFADMQDTLRQAFLQRERLAQLGLSVSKISHDLRHSLGAAQLVSERLSAVDDPVVRLTAPRLERALERAINLAQSTLKFGKAQEAPPEPELLYLADVLDEAANEALMGLIGVTWVQEVDALVDVEADGEQLHRLLTNLIRNAAQAIIRAKKPGSIIAKATFDADRVCVDLIDTGPGLPRGVQENLFAPFSGSGVSGGSGLGLAIARDLARMNGGDVKLVSTGPEGTCFRICLRAPGEDVEA